MSREKKAKLETLKSDAENQPKNSGRKEIPHKCLTCATLTMSEVHELHGGEGGCWNPDVCRSRRYHAKNHNTRNAARNLKNRSGDRSQIAVPKPDINYAVLVVYSLEALEDTPVHALGAEVWNAEGCYQYIEARHCAGMTPARVYQEVDAFLVELDSAHGLKHFALEVRLDVKDCPVRPCPYHRVGRA